MIFIVFQVFFFLKHCFYYKVPKIIRVILASEGEGVKRDLNKVGKI